MSKSHDRFRAAAQELGLEIVSMPLAYELPDGGRVDVTDTTVVPMGDVFAHRQVTYTHTGDADLPACLIVFEVRSGVPVCISVQLSVHGETYVRARDLTAVKLDNLRDSLYAYVGVFVESPDGGWMRKLGGWPTFQQDRKRVEQATQRRKMTPEFLARVAGIHNTARVGERLEAVKAAFGVKERQALRYIKLARQKGLIDDE